MLRGGVGVLALLVSACFPPVQGVVQHRALVRTAPRAGDPVPDGKQGRRGGPMCIFVRTATVVAAGIGRDQVRAVADTWVKDAPSSVKIFFFIDEQVKPYHLPASIPEDHMIKITSGDYDELPQRTRQILVSLNSIQFISQCDWFLVVDDDTYVNVANVVSKTKDLDADKEHYMGALYSYGKNRPFVHGDFQLYSRAAVPVISVAAARCNDWRHGWDDVASAECFRTLGLFKDMPPEVFGFFVHDNSRGHHPTTLQQALNVTQTGRDPSCIDFLHKMDAGDMRAFHDILQNRSTCTGVGK